MPVFTDVKLTYKMITENAAIIGVYCQFWLPVLPRMCARNIDDYVNTRAFRKLAILIEKDTHTHAVCM
jgi:hypothetical protein